MNPQSRSTLNRAAQEDQPRPRSTATLIVVAVTAALFFAVFAALGTWQVQRLSWKLDLIERVEQRAYAAPVALPEPSSWAHITAASDEYRHVSLAGTYLYDLTTRVQAATEHGSGYWLMTPLQLDDGNVVFVNRGFISPAGVDVPRQEAASSDLRVSVTGLLRMSEPGGGFLRENNPGQGRWYSRDVQAMAEALGLARVPPFFIDADAGAAGTVPSGRGYPIGGLTVLRFHNNHLVYAFTWYALALMVAGGAWWVIREERRLRRNMNRS